MASLFTPESDRIAAGQKTKASQAAPQANGVRVPGMGQIKSDKPADSLGNGSTPGYESWGKKKQQPATPEGKSGETAPGGMVIETTAQGPEIIRLSAGWEKLLLAQKKLCEKAKGLFTLLEGPSKYTEGRKSKILSMKSRGCIVDLDVQQAKEEADAKAKREKESA